MSRDPPRSRLFHVPKHNPRTCPICECFRWRILNHDPGLRCIHSGDPCDRCGTTARERGED